MVDGIAKIVAKLPRRFGFHQMDTDQSQAKPPRHDGRVVYYRGTQTSRLRQSQRGRVRPPDRLISILNGMPRTRQSALICGATSSMFGNPMSMRPNMMVSDEHSRERPDRGMSTEGQPSCRFQATEARWMRLNHEASDSTHEKHKPDHLHR